jgi:hypothetical protein
MIKAQAHLSLRPKVFVQKVIQGYLRLTIPGRGKEDRERWSSNDGFYSAGVRSTADLSILCPTHHKRFHKDGEELISGLLNIVLSHTQ